jgi:hypothetical protein
VSDYGLDDQAIGVRFPAGAKDFSCSLCFQTGSGAHPASCPMGAGIGYLIGRELLFGIRMNIYKRKELTMRNYY